MTVTPFTEEEQARFAQLAERVADELAAIPQGYQLAEHEFTGKDYYKARVAEGKGITLRKAKRDLLKLVEAGTLNAKKETIVRSQTNVYWWPEKGDEAPAVRVGRNGAGFSVVKEYDE